MLTRTFLPTTASTGATLQQRLAWSAARRLQRWLFGRQLRATARVLHGLDDRMLRDIGLDRSEIDSVVGTLAADRHPRRFELETRGWFG